MYTLKDIIDFENVHLFESKANGKQPLNPRLIRNSFSSSVIPLLFTNITLDTLQSKVSHVRYVRFFQRSPTILFVKPALLPPPFFAPSFRRYLIFEMDRRSKIMQSPDTYFCSLRIWRQKKKNGEKAKGKAKKIGQGGIQPSCLSPFSKDIHKTELLIS